MKHAFIFPGQGSQFPGMAKDLYDRGGKFRDTLETADEIIGFRITDIMFNGSADDLKQTRVTQPAVFLHSVVKAMEYDVTPDVVAGHSLGEFSALAVCGALRFEDALRLVSIRAAAMQKACEARKGAMAAIIALPPELIERICAEVSAAADPDSVCCGRESDGNAGQETAGCGRDSAGCAGQETAGCAGAGIVVAANYNCDGQTVISGDSAAVEQACERLKEAGAKRALILPVGGAFHSPLMEPARAELAAAIESVNLHRPVCPIYQNFTAAPSTDPETIKRNLLAQLTGPVRWSETVRNIASDASAANGLPKSEAVDFTEIGPGTVLTGLIRKIALD